MFRRFALNLDRPVNAVILRDETDLPTYKSLDASGGGCVARIILRQAKLFVGFLYAASWKRPSTNFAWPMTSFLCNLLTCPFLIMFTASINLLRDKREK